MHVNPKLFDLRKKNLNERVLLIIAVRILIKKLKRENIYYENHKRVQEKLWTMQFYVFQ